MSKPWHLPADKWSLVANSPGWHLVLDPYRHVWHLEVQCEPNGSLWRCLAEAEGMGRIEDTVAADIHTPQLAVDRCYQMADARMDQA